MIDAASFFRLAREADVACGDYRPIETAEVIATRVGEGKWRVRRHVDTTVCYCTFGSREQVLARLEGHRQAANEVKAKRHMRAGRVRKAVTAYQAGKRAERALEVVEESNE